MDEDFRTPEALAEAHAQRRHFIEKYHRAFPEDAAHELNRDPNSTSAESLRQLAQLGAAVRRVEELNRLRDAAVLRVRTLADVLKLGDLARAVEAGDAKWIDVTMERSLTSLDALAAVEEPRVPGLTAGGAAARYGYSRSGAREVLERAAAQGLVRPQKERRDGKWHVVYTPTEKAAALFTQKALPAGAP